MESSIERVVITGLGTVNAVAAGAPAFANALKAGARGIGPITVFDTAPFRTEIGGEVRGFSPTWVPRRYRGRRRSRADHMAVFAALEALTDAGLDPDGAGAGLRESIGVVIGGGAGGMLECEAVYRDYLASGPDRVRMSPFSAFCCASSADQIATAFGLMGPKTTFMTACSSGATAIGYARDLVRSGAARMVVAGGTEPLSRITYAAFNGLQAVDPAPCRPFDRDRRGLSLGEGAGVLILESLSSVRDRGARIYAEVLGYGVSCDAHHMTAPDPTADGAIRCITAALTDAGIPPSAVDHINAHGTATPANDRMETAAIKAVFGDRAYRIPVSATKSMHGHTLGAAGAIEAVASALAIADGFIPPTIHHTTPDPECDLDYVADGPRPYAPTVVLSNSFAFGGNNTALVLGRYTDGGIGHD